MNKFINFEHLKKQTIMKKILGSVIALFTVITLSAQINAPQPSPSSKTIQKIGLTDVTLEYSRPSAKGRTVFGNLVPYNKMWRTGANANTKITFSTSFTVGETTLKAGTYAIYSVPNKDSWEIIFYTDANNGGLPTKWDDAKVAAKIKVNSYQLDMKVETFTITFDDLTNNSASLGIIWENTYLSVPFGVPTDTAVMASIKRTMNGPSAGDFYAAAVYYKEANKDIKQAVEWINKSVSLTGSKTPFWVLRQQSLILAKSGDKKGAINAAKLSLEGAKKANNNDYIKMNTESIKEWSGR